MKTEKLNVKELKAAMASYQENPTKENTLAVIEECAKLYRPEAAELVKDLERKPFTTQNNYGGYVSALLAVKGFWRGGLVLALKDAGAGPGLIDALRIVGGE